VSPRVELWVEQRDGVPAVNPVVRLLLDDLAADGHPVRVRVPEREPDLDPVDVVLLKTPTTLALALAATAEAGGARVANPAPASRAAGDKAFVVARLAAAGLPVPESHLRDPAGPPAAPPAGPGWVTKPVLGWHGGGVLVHADAAAALGPGGCAPAVPGALVDDGTRLLQRRVGGGEPDVKAYVAGEHVFAAEKAFDRSSFARDEVRAVELDAAADAVVRSAGEVLGLRLYGVDLRRGDAGPVVVDVNPFPGYRGFPAAAAAALRAEVDRVLGGVPR